MDFERSTRLSSSQPNKNTDKWCHSISLRLTFMSGTWMDGWGIWISASSLVLSCLRMRFPMLVTDESVNSATQRTWVVKPVMMMCNQGGRKDHLCKHISVCFPVFLTPFRHTTTPVHVICVFVFGATSLSYFGCQGFWQEDKMFIYRHSKSAVIENSSCVPSWPCGTDGDSHFTLASCDWSIDGIEHKRALPQASSRGVLEEQR